MPGADEDAARIAAFIRANVDRITSIYVTLDTHQVTWGLGESTPRLHRLLHYKTYATKVSHPLMHTRTANAHQPRALLAGAGRRAAPAVHGHHARGRARGEVDARQPGAAGA